MADLTTTHEDGTENNQGQVTQVEINGEMVDLEELKKGYMRQSDYTKKTQELAQQRKQQTEEEPEEEQDDVIAAKNFVKSYLDELGLTNLPKSIKQRQDDEAFSRIAEYEPSLKSQEQAIKKIAEVEGLSIEDVISTYNFLSSDKLEKAKESRQLVGRVGVEEKKEKSINDMTPAEWEAYKAKLKGG